MSRLHAQLQSYNIPNYYIIQTADSVHGGAVTLERQIQPQVWEIVTPGLCNTKGTALKYSYCNCLAGFQCLFTTQKWISLCRKQ